MIFKEEKKVLLKIKKYLTGASSENKDEIITLDPIIQESQKGPNAIDEINKEIMKFDIYLEKTEIKIMLFKKVIYSKKFDLEKLLGDSINVYLESSKDKKENAIQDFSVCYLKGESNPPRSLEEKEELDHFELDYVIMETSPSTLNDGSIQITPKVALLPKSKNGNFPSEILNYSGEKLDSLFNIVHSKNESFYYQVHIINKKRLVMNLECEFPGDIYITSDYFKNIDKYIINIGYIIGNQILDI